MRVRETAFLEFNVLDGVEEASSIGEHGPKDSHET